MFRRMPRPTALFVPASIVLTVVACGQRPDFKKNDPQWAIADGIYRNDEPVASNGNLEKQRLGPDYEQLDYSHYQVLDGKLFLFSASETCGEKTVEVGTLAKRAGIEYELTPNSALQADPCLTEEMGPGDGAAGFLAWTAGGKARARLHGGVLKLTNSRGQTRGYRQTPTAAADSVRRKVGETQKLKNGRIIGLLQAVEGKTFELTQRVELKKKGDKVKLDEDEGFTVAAKTAAARRMTEEERARALRDERRREAAKPVPVKTDANDIPTEEPVEVDGRKLLKINVKTLEFLNEKTVRINGKHEGRVRYHLRRSGRGERAAGAEERLEIEIKLAPSVDADRYAIARSEERMRGVPLWWPDGRMRLMMSDRREKTYFYNDFQAAPTDATDATEETPAP